MKNPVIKVDTSRLNWRKITRNRELTDIPNGSLVAIRSGSEEFLATKASEGCGIRGFRRFNGTNGLSDSVLPCFMAVMPNGNLEAPWDGVCEDGWIDLSVFQLGDLNVTHYELKGPWRENGYPYDTVFAFKYAPENGNHWRVAGGGRVIPQVFTDLVTHVRPVEGYGPDEWRGKIPQKVTAKVSETDEHGWIDVAAIGGVSKLGQRYYELKGPWRKHGYPHDTVFAFRHASGNRWAVAGGGCYLPDVFEKEVTHVRDVGTNYPEEWFGKMPQVVQSPDSEGWYDLRVTDPRKAICHGAVELRGDWEGSAWGYLTTGVSGARDHDKLWESFLGEIPLPPPYDNPTHFRKAKSAPLAWTYGPPAAKTEKERLRDRVAELERKLDEVAKAAGNGGA